MAGTFQAAKFSGDVSKWDTSKVTNMMYTFRDNGPEFQDITTMVTKNIFNSQLTWDTSQVTTMNGMFWGEDAFNHHLVWDTSRVKSMRFMFYGASDFNQQLAWDTSKVTDMDHMFYGASDFNQQLVWDTSRVNSMKGMFGQAFRFKQQLDWDTSRVSRFEGMVTAPPLARLAPPRGARTSATAHHRTRRALASSRATSPLIASAPTCRRAVRLLGHEVPQAVPRAPLPLAGVLLLNVGSRKRGWTTRSPRVVVVVVFSSLYK